MDPDQLASEKPADQDLHCFQSRIYFGLVWEGLMCLRLQNIGRFISMFAFG